MCARRADRVRMLLRRWIEMARAWGQTAEEKNLMEFNARNLVTLWGPRGEIADYASKQWSGLIADYYR
jgi:alpha-N-acetylglucosaminidase